MKIAIICSNTAERKWKFWTYLQLQDGGRGILLATTTTFVRSYFCLRSLFYYSEKLCWLGKIWAVDVSFDEVVKSEPWVRLVWRTIYLKASVKKKKKKRNRAKKKILMVWFSERDANIAVSKTRSIVGSTISTEPEYYKLFFIFIFFFRSSPCHIFTVFSRRGTCPHNRKLRSRMLFLLSIAF